MSLDERVTSDPRLNAAEKETTLTMCGDDKYFKMFSSKPTVVKSILQHDHFDVEWVEGKEKGNYQRREKGNENNLDEIYSVCATAPIGLLTVKTIPRTNNYQSGIVNHETIDPEAFA